VGEGGIRLGKGGIAGFWKELLMAFKKPGKERSPGTKGLEMSLTTMGLLLTIPRIVSKERELKKEMLAQ